MTPRYYAESSTPATKLVGIWNKHLEFAKKCSNNFYLMGDTLLGNRDKALLLTAYDTMCCRIELVELQIEDLQCDDVMAPKTRQRRLISKVLLRYSKTDPHRKGKWLNLGQECYEAIQDWLYHTNI